MRKKGNGKPAKSTKTIKVWIRILFLTLLFWDPSGSAFFGQTLRVTVQIREVVMFEISSASNAVIGSGREGAEISYPLAFEDNPVVIKARLCVSPERIVRLQVLIHGDLDNQKGEKTTASQVAWEAVGPGFVNGRFDENIPQVMATWKGSGLHEGKIKFYFLESPPWKDFHQTVSYHLMIL